MAVPAAKPESVEIFEVSFGKTIPLREYENARIDLKAKVQPGQDWQTVLKALKEHVAREEQQLLDEISS